MSEAFPGRRSRDSFPGAIALLRAMVFVAIASLGVSASPTMAQFAAMPQSCLEVLPHTDDAPAGKSDVAETHERGTPSSHQIVCAVGGCVVAEPAGYSSSGVDMGLPDSISYAISDTFGSGGVVLPGRRPPIALQPRL